MKKNVLILKATLLPDERIFQRIDIWWRGKNKRAIDVAICIFCSSKTSPGPTPVFVFCVLSKTKPGKPWRSSICLIWSTMPGCQPDVEVIVSQAPPLEVIALESQQADLRANGNKPSLGRKGSRICSLSANGQSGTSQCLTGKKRRNRIKLKLPAAVTFFRAVASTTLILQK